MFVLNYIVYYFFSKNVFTLQFKIVKKYRFIVEIYRITVTALFDESFGRYCPLFL